MRSLFLLTPAHSPISITTNCEKFCNSLKEKYGLYISEKEITTKYNITAIFQENTYTVITPQGEQQTNTPLLALDRYLFQNASYHNHLFALHGAAVEWNGEASLFLAATTSGKTTLTSYLTSCGCGYITDDCILLERSTFMIEPYATPIELRDGGLDVLNRYRVIPNNLYLLEEEKVFRRWVYTPNNCVKYPIPLKRIFFIERTEQENALIDMNATERISSLMRAPITNYEINGDYLRFLSRLAKIDCRILRYCDMDYVKELIQNEQ